MVNSRINIPDAVLIQRSSLKNQATAALRKHIIVGNIPPGPQLVERDVAQLLNISRGPTREAFIELENQGLVINAHNRRHVIEPTVQEEIDMFEVRSPLEKRAAERAAERSNHANQDELRARLSRMEGAAAEQDWTAFFLAELELHQTIWSQSGNVYLEDALNTMSSPIFMALVNDSFQGFDRDETVELHRDLVESINRRNSTLAGRLAVKNMDDAFAQNRSRSSNQN